jgi:hypothetical protein
LDDLYEGMEFGIEARSAVTGVALVVTMMYSAGLPILTIFALCNFSLSFVIDKWMLINKYSQPPMYGPAVPKVLVNLLPVGTFIHMAVGLYMLANKQILYGPDLTSTVWKTANKSHTHREMSISFLQTFHSSDFCLPLFFFDSRRCGTFFFFLFSVAG